MGAADHLPPRPVQPSMSSVRLRGGEIVPVVIAVPELAHAGGIVYRRIHVLTARLHEQDLAPGINEAAGENRPGGSRTHDDRVELFDHVHSSTLRRQRDLCTPFSFPQSTGTFPSLHA